MKPNLIICSFVFFLFSCQKKDVKNADVIASKTDTLLQKNGTVLTFNKPSQSLVSLKRDQTVYSENYLKRLEKVAEYYIANSKQSLVNFHKAKPESVLGYSFEENDWEGVNYTQIGIFNRSGSNMSTLQWLFYEPKSQKLYEFDLNQKKLIEFK